MKKKLLTFFFSVLLVTIGLLSPPTICADGMIIKPDPYSDRWDYINENNQQAFINYQDGLEKMIISVGLEEAERDVVWIFPVPADPNKIGLDIFKELPKLSGEEISLTAKKNFSNLNSVLQSTQVYTIPFILVKHFLGYSTTGKGFGRGLEMTSGKIDEKAPNLIIHTHLEKEGVTSEIITAKTADALYDYLKGWGLNIKSGSVPILDYYIGKEFSFLASWITPQELLPTSNYQADYRPPYGIEEVTRSPVTQRGVFVTFPTQKIYYPLVPTSVYGNTIVPATIRVLGHVSPKIFADLKGYASVEYFTDKKSSPSTDLKDFFGKNPWNLKYTKIEIRAPSRLLTNDLWINPQAPLKTYYSTFVAKHPGICFLVLLFFSSMLAGMFTAPIVFVEFRNKEALLKFGRLGLSNCLSLIGLSIATLLTKTKKITEEMVPLLKEIKQKGYFGRRKLSLVLTIIVLPFLPFFVPLALTLPIQLVGFVIDTINSRPSYYPIKGSLFFTTITVLVLGVIRKLHVINPQDQPLFDCLKQNHYSSWTFCPKDNRKFTFIFVFSLSFLLISWLLVKIGQYTV